MALICDKIEKRIDKNHILGVILTETYIFITLQATLLNKGKNLGWLQMFGMR